jgi:serine/threonine-protein kinase
MGEVRKCQDSLLDRSVALKAVKPEADIHDFEERFLREARVQARLAHPGVVPVYDLGRDENGRVYFTMKRVEGVTIEEVIVAHRSKRPAPYDRRQLLTAFARACLTVDFAHSRGVLHRDLKPANLMLGAYGEVYVLDWGLAKVTDMQDLPAGEITIRSQRRSKQTEVGVAMGTPAYMSPEQATAQALDARSDVFSLGAILYEILTSEQLLDEHAIRLIRHRQRLQIHPRTGVDELDAICFKATAYEADKRYPTARALHDAVDAFLSADEEGRRRRRLAAIHIERAKAYDSDEMRPQALESLGKALALDPDDEAARTHLVDLLRHPPKTTPAEVTQRRVQAELGRLRRMQGTIAVIYLAAWMVAYPGLVAFAGVENLVGAFLAPAAWMVCAAVIGFQYVKKIRPGFAISSVFTALAIAATSMVWGPMFIVPGLAVVMVFGHLLVGDRQQRAVTVSLITAAVAVPSILAIRGIFHVYTPITHDAFLIHGSVGVTRPIFYVGVVGANVLQVVFGARFAGRYRDQLDKRVLENALFSWQLANLVPRSSQVVDRRSRPSLLASDELSISLAANDAIVQEAGAALVVDADAPDHHRYQKVAHIGSTACTEIWRCLDRRLGREVDMHLSKSAHDDVATLAQARACGRLEHPTNAPVYDVGTDRHGRVYYTIKNLRGVTLDVVAATLPNEHAYRRLLATFGQVCLAIAYAHERRVYHRSLNPRQVMLGSFGEVYVQGWNAKPFESIRDAEEDTRALRKMLEELADGHRVTIAGLPFAKTPRDIHDAIEAFLAGSRDEEVRAELAAAHSERANAAAAHAFASSGTFESEAEARVAALREVGRAVRLEPGDQSAVQLLFKLMTEPPKHPPPAVLREVERLRDQRARGPARSTAVFGAAWLVVYPVIAFLLGVKHPTSVLVIWAVWALSFVAVLHHVLRKTTTMVPWSMLATMFAGIVTAALVGPFFFTPIIGTFATMAFVVTVPSGWRKATVFLGLLIVTVPAILGVTGIHPAGDVVANMVVSNGALGSPSSETLLLVLTAMHLISVLFAAEYASRFRDRLDVVEQAYLLRTWQLTKLVRS